MLHSKLLCHEFFFDSFFFSATEVKLVPTENLK